MKMPQHFKARPKAEGRPAQPVRQPAQAGAVAPAGCCAWVELPFVGRHCVSESPFCP